MTETHRYHPETGARLRRDVRPVTIHWGTLSRTIDVPGWYPDEPEGDAIHTGTELAELDRALAAMKRDYAAHVRQVRKSLGLTQAAAGVVVGGGKRAFQKYESGSMLPSDSAIALIELLGRDPAAIEVLKKLPGRTMQPA